MNRPRQVSALMVVALLCHVTRKLSSSQFPMLKMRSPFPEMRRDENDPTHTLVLSAGSSLPSSQCCWHSFCFPFHPLTERAGEAFPCLFPLYRYRYLELSSSLRNTRARDAGPMVERNELAALRNFGTKYGACFL